LASKLGAGFSVSSHKTGGVHEEIRGQKVGSQNLCPGKAKSCRSPSDAQRWKFDQNTPGQIVSFVVGVGVEVSFLNCIRGEGRVGWPRLRLPSHFLLLQTPCSCEVKASCA